MVFSGEIAYFCFPIKVHFSLKLNDMINPIYSPDSKRYDNGMKYRRCGRSGILLPEVSLGLWHNFGDVNTFSNSQAMAHYAFDQGITHFDLANNYGPSYGSAEETFGMIMKKSFMPYRDELFISTKAGHDMWPGPYGEWGSRKYLMNSLNQSLKRMNLDYVDIYCLHRDDERIPVGEIVDVMDNVVKEGFARSIGVSNWSAKRLNEANEYARKHNRTPFTSSQIQWNMAHCTREDMLDKTLYFMDDEEYKLYKENKIPVMAYSPQAVGFFSKYLESGEEKLSDRAKMYCTDVNKKRAEKVRQLCEKLGCSPAALCVAYITCNPVDGYAVVSNSTMKQMEDTLTGVDLKITQDMIDWILD